MLPHYRVLQMLSAKHFVSGEQVGVRCAVSKAAVWKSIQKLRQLGIDVIAVHGRGYKLAEPIDWLEATAIKPLLSDQIQSQLECFNISLTELSTNNVLLNQDCRDSRFPIQVLMTEHQTGGRGRRGKTWASPMAQNIYLSIAVTLPQLLTSYSGLSIEMGLKVASLLQAYLPEIKLKWPNDLLVNNQKIAGILIDVKVLADGSAKIVFGLGLNVNALPDEQEMQFVDQPWTSLRSQLGVALDRNPLLVELLEALIPILLAPTQNFQRWEEFDYLADKLVNVLVGERSFQARAAGINDQGNLQVIDEQGQLLELTGGEVSVKSVPCG